MRYAESNKIQYFSIVINPRFQSESNQNTIRILSEYNRILIIYNQIVFDPIGIAYPINPGNAIPTAPGTFFCIKQ